MLVQLTDEYEDIDIAPLFPTPSLPFIRPQDRSSLTPLIVLPTDETDDADNAEKLENRRLRASYCMSSLRIRDSATGIMREVQKPCREWRVCARCHKWRVNTFKSRITRALEVGPVRLEMLTDDAATKAVRKYGKALIIRLPQENGNDAVFVATDDDLGKPVTLDTLDQFKWSALVRTPEGAHVSGQLGKLPEPVESKVAIKQSAYAIDGLSNDELAKADIKSIRATASLNPKTPDDLEEAIGKRDKVYLREIKKLGGTVTFRRTLYVKIENDHIRWKMTLPETIKAARIASQERPAAHKPRYRETEYENYTPEERMIELERHLRGW